MNAGRITILDDVLRDGQHAVSHKMTPPKMAEIAVKLENSGVTEIEAGHGNGISGSSFQYGFGAATDKEYLSAVARSLKKARLAIILLPGIGTAENLKMAADCGVKIARISTQITEADISEQHIKMAKALGMEARGIITQAQPLSVDHTIRQAKLMESFGADVVYLFDGSGYMLPNDIRERFTAMKSELKVPLGFHGHNNLQLALANTLTAIECGATHIDTCLKGFGAGAGNCPTELLVAACNRMKIETGIDLFEILDIGRDEIVPMMPRPMELTDDCLMLGYAGVYSSFRLFAQRAAEKYGVDSRKVIMEAGARKCTEGQEDLCIDVAYSMSENK